MGGNSSDGTAAQVYLEAFCQVNDQILVKMKDTQEAAEALILSLKEPLDNQT